MARKHRTLTVRLSDEVSEKLDLASKLGPYPVSLTAIVERGIELALREIEAMNQASEKALSQ